MKWFKVRTPRIEQPTVGTYLNWKPLLRVEGNYQCVYCAIHEAAWGGFRNFHVEHYRPKARFQDLTNIISNLFYACAICNSFKGDDWPGEPTPALETVCYPDPSVRDYNELYRDGQSWTIQGATMATKFLLERLYLNRPQLILERRTEALYREYQEIMDKLVQTVSDMEKAGQAIPISLVREFATVTADIADYLNAQRNIPPYEPEDVKRPK